MDRPTGVPERPYFYFGSTRICEAAPAVFGSFAGSKELAFVTFGERKVMIEVLSNLFQPIDFSSYLC